MHHNQFVLQVQCLTVVVVFSLLPTLPYLYLYCVVLLNADTLLFSFFLFKFCHMKM